MRRLILLGLITSVSACASGGQRAPGSRCAGDTERLALEEAVGAELTQSVREAVTSVLAEAPATGTARLRVRRDRDSTQVVVTASTLPPSTSDALVIALQRVLPATGAPDTAPSQPLARPPVADTAEKSLRPRNAFALHVTASGSTVTQLEGERLLTCAPVILNRDELGTIVGRAAASVPNRGTVLMWLLVDETGAVTRVQVAQSSGDEVVDALGSTVGYAARFRPADNDGEPTRVWVQIPIAIR